MPEIAEPMWSAHRRRDALGGVYCLIEVAFGLAGEGVIGVRRRIGRVELERLARLDDRLVVAPRVIEPQTQVRRGDDRQRIDLRRPLRFADSIVVTTDGGEQCRIPA